MELRLIMNEFYRYIRKYLVVYLPTLRKMSKQTIKTYKESINQFLDYVSEIKEVNIENINFETIDSATLQMFVTELDRLKMKSSSINVRISAIRSFYKYVSSVDHSLMVYRNEIMKVPLRKNKNQGREMEYLTVEQINEILHIPNPYNPIGLRDLMILMVLYDSAVRVNELRHIRIRDIYFGRVSYIRVTGKGLKVRNTPITSNTAKIIKKYLNTYHCNPLPESFLIYPSNTNATIMMSDDNINRIIKKYACMTSSIEHGNKIHAHMFRHSRAMHLRKSGMSLELIAEFLGHSDLSTTLIYSSADVEMKAKAINKAMENLFSNEKESEEETSNDFKVLVGLK